MKISPSAIKKTVIFAAFLTIFVFSLNQLNESDIFYHIKTGEIIWSTRSVPTADIFSYTSSGVKWVPHEWLSQLIFYGIYKIGFIFLILFPALIAIVVSGLIYILLRREGVDYRAILPVLTVSSFFSTSFWVPRPQIFAYLCFAAIIFFLREFLRKGKVGSLFAVIAVMLFWANTNASFLLGIITIAVFFFWQCLKRIRPREFGESISVKQFKLFVFAVIACVFIPLLNPAGINAYFYIKTVAPAANFLQVGEWRSIIGFINIKQPKYLIAALIAGVSFFSFLWLWYKKRKSDFAELFVLAAAVSITPFISVRYIGFWVIAASIALSLALSGKKFSDFMVKFGKMIGIFFIIALVFFLSFRIITFPKRLWNSILIPDTAVDFLEEKDIKGPIFHLYNEGMYLIYRLYPKEKVFIDGRSEIYGRETLEDLMKIINGVSDWEKLVYEKYKIECFFLPYYPLSLWNNLKPLAQKLIDHNWALLYFDDGAAIFIRPDGKNATLANNAFKHINPFRNPSDIPIEEFRESAYELDRLIKMAPESILVKHYAELFLLSHPNGLLP